LSGISQPPRAQPALEVMMPLPPLSVTAPSPYAGGAGQPLWMAARPDRVWAPGRMAQQVSSGTEMVDLPPPTFMQPIGDPTQGYAQGTLVEVPGGPQSPVLGDPGGVTIPQADPEPTRRGFFAKVFGPGVEALGDSLVDLRFDYINFYSPRSLLWLGAGVGVDAILANTSMDQHFRNWYQDEVHSPTTAHIHDDIAWLGNGGYMLPIFLIAGFVPTPFEEYSPTASVIGTWGRRATRAFLTGGPMLLALQYGLGAHRPSAGLDSHWHPFQDSHGASGDAWVGAITFMTAAKMTDSRLAKVALYSLALFPAWGRIDVDQHYLSQVVLGVWLGALSVEAVDVTERSTQMFVVPSVMPGGAVGMNLGWRW
jgi:hypothetical protein